MKHLVLKNVTGFDEPKAVLLAYCLQRTKHDLKLVDIRGCNIGEPSPPPKLLGGRLAVAHDIESHVQPFIY